ncbi:hypothetical protein LSM04_007695 [Trypanosoma melophagium]|uniref:uncharacterized protein n=1 Tax=Trypanosoma melophagium TaxID=715481 RepID=UPI003519E008|nr:hypothetical protein LSM04_007695 [Trypanosoma melophagium]
MLLSRRVQLSPDVIDSSLRRLNCVSQDIVEVDIHPTVLSLLTTAAPDEVRRAVAELPPHNTADERREAEQVDFSGAGINTAVAFSLHTVLLSRNRLTKTLGIVQFKNTVRLSLLGNRLQRIEDCEPLSLLPSLQYLSLEFNPVTSLPHYRAHILRICSWPDSLQPKSCRLKKLDTRSVLPAEVERAAQCLQREKVTMGELVNRMRFLSLLIEAEKRIALHHEIRRRGFIIQDTILQLTVENVVTRCSTQLLALVDVSAASHLARRLMSGKCRLCSISAENSMMSNNENVDDMFIDDTHTETETSHVASAISLSISRPYMVTLNNPKKETLTAFCKDWSRDVFRRAMASLDHRICELLLSIAHSLGEELTVMDVDHLNKLWFTQVAKVDSYRFYEQQPRNKKSTIKNEKLLLSTTKNENSLQITEKVKKLEEDENMMMMMVHIEEDSKNQNPNDIHTESETDIDVISLRNVSPISHPVALNQRNDLPIKKLHEFGSVVLEEDYISHNNHQVKNNGFISLKRAEVEDQNSDRASLFLSREAPLPFPPPPPSMTKRNISDQEQINLLNHHIKRRIFRKWESMLRKKEKDNLCTKYIQQRLENLLLYSLPTPHAISSMMQMLPRMERKRVVFRFWREQARLLYAPRSFRLGQLLMRWRWRAYEQQNITLIATSRRARTLINVWRRWREAVQNHIEKIHSQSINYTNIMEKNNNNNSVPQYSSLLHNDCVGNLSSSRGILSKETQVSFEKWSESKDATNVTQGLTCSTKPSAEAVYETTNLQQVEQTPGVAACLSLPMVTPITDTSPPIRMPLLSDKATQTMESPSYDQLAAEYKAAIIAEADETIAAIQVDRLRMVDRIIALEQRVNEECVRVKHRDEEIEDLKEKLTAMTIREECMKSGLDDYNREIEHLRAVVQALREERRELLRPLVR